MTLLAQRGAEALSYRNLDEAAALPVGTAANYFRTRADLLVQLTRHVLEQLRPDPATVTAALAGPEQERHAALLQHLLDRMLREREATLALLELRLLARRHPDIQDAFRETIQANLALSQAFSDTHGFTAEPGAFLMGYLLLSGFVFEELTLPGLLPPDLGPRLIQALTGTGPAGSSDGADGPEWHLP
ncbi:TetR family transcriptional regulator [Deinococcus radiotolerans]|uniref:TetR family transcriptional regulator n=2 Tax=Deinococcus radiotolerans TaxID=1309407 RepID=A0ABQ2FQ99_9DEIO|nr:TetR family transcriptional regulator [Deinococcus radiotolerans]